MTLVGPGPGEVRVDLERMITRRIDLADLNTAVADMLNGEVIRSVIEFNGFDWLPRQASARGKA